jgi:succinate dehydrogenase / fumarate reductase cytochrome b subunit
VVDKRPVNLDLTTVKFPVTALASITHRVTGVVLLAGILILLWMLGMSLHSQESFNELQELMSKIYAKLILWAILAALAYHFVAGLRHLLMDLGFWETLSGGKASAVFMFLSSVILMVLAGVWVW